jgi:DNA polymerase-3 subunit alpha
MSRTISPKSSALDPGFIHLHVHSAYSLLQGSITITKLVELAKADHQPALALTDNDNMFGALEFSDKVAGYGIQPITGCAMAVVSAIRTRRRVMRLHRRGSSSWRPMRTATAA